MGFQEIDLVNITLRGSVAYALRDLMAIEGKEVDWDLIAKMVNEELWPRMCLWMGLNPNFNVTINQTSYRKDEIEAFGKESQIRYCPWVWIKEIDQYQFVPETAQPTQTAPSRPIPNTAPSVEKEPEPPVKNPETNLEKWVKDINNLFSTGEDG